MALFPALRDALGGGKAAEVFSDSVIVGGSAFAIAALARAINQSKSDVEEYSGAPLSQHLNTTMRDPLVTEDMAYMIEGYKDPKATAKKDKESKWYKLLKKGSEESESSKGFLSTIIDPVFGLFRKSTWDPKELTTWAVPAGVGVLAAIAGHKMIDNMYDKSDKSALSSKQDRLAKLHKKLILARALNRRGRLSEDGFNSVMTESEPIALNADIHKTANDDTAIIMPAAGLLIAVAATVGAIAGNNYSSARNDRRLAYKAIKEGLKQYAQTNSLMRPIEYSAVADDDLYRALKDSTSKDKKSPTETPMIYNPVSVNI